MKLEKYVDGDFNVQNKHIIGNGKIAIIQKCVLTLCKSANIEHLLHNYIVIYICDASILELFAIRVFLVSNHQIKSRVMKLYMYFN